VEEAEIALENQSILFSDYSNLPKNMVIECVAWYQHDPASSRRISTGPVLLCAKSGAVYETEIDPTEEFLKREERYFKQVRL
jgi:hypothetical protein